MKPDVSCIFDKKFVEGPNSQLFTLTSMYMFIFNTMTVHLVYYTLQDTYEVIF